VKYLLAVKDYNGNGVAKIGHDYSGSVQQQVQTSQTPVAANYNPELLRPH
jgi:hypothetical protein